MELKVVRLKEEAAIPSNPEKINSILTMAQTGLIALVPSNYSLDESKYDLIHTIDLTKKDDEEIVKKKKK